MTGVHKCEYENCTDLHRQHRPLLPKAQAGDGRPLNLRP
jgi:hypothetical protein